MFEFVALLWNAQRAEHTALSRQLADRLPALREAWREILSAPGIRVFCNRSLTESRRAIRFSNGSGVIIGDLFQEVPQSPQGAHSVANLSVDIENEIIQLEGKALANKFWGQYVAFLTDTQRSKHWAIRSPTGEVECQHVVIDGVHIFFSSLNAFPVQSMQSCNFNWDYIAASLATSIYEAQATGIREVRQLMHGECYELHAGQAKSILHWDPCEVAARAPMADPELAALELRRCIHAVAKSWSHRYKRLLLMLSGGLDSSIALSSIAEYKSPSDIVCLNYRNVDDPNTDEREYARVMARAKRVELLERDWPSTFSLDKLFNFRPTVFPTVEFHGQPAAELTASISRSLGVDAGVHGVGGDQLFFKGGSRFAWLDYRRQHGLKSEVFHLAMDSARAQGTTFWNVICTGVTASPKDMFMPRDTLQKCIPSAVNELVCEKLLFMHPSLASNHSLPPGKWHHAMMITSCLGGSLSDSRTTEETLETLSLFASQPVVELALRIPSYILTSVGEDRALARRAFRSDLPEKIASRRTKGWIYEAGKALLRNNLPLVRETLLDGHLVRERLLDRKVLEATLKSDEVGGHPGQSTFLLRYFCCEAWAQTWSRTPVRKAA